VSLTFEVEQPGCVVDIIEHIRGRLVDGDRTGMMLGIRLLASVQAERVKTKELGVDHCCTARYTAPREWSPRAALPCRIMATFELSEITQTDRYKLLTGLVVPRPIGWIGTVDNDGVRNLAPYSFFNCVSATPPTVVVGTGSRDGAPKDTLSNLHETGVFTVSIVTEEVAEAMSVTSTTFPPHVDEFAEAGLRPVMGSTVAAPYVGEAKAALECEVNQIVPLGEPPTSWLVIADVRTIHIDDDLLDGTRVDAHGLKAVGRFAGSQYSATADGLFDLERPE